MQVERTLSYQNKDLINYYFSPLKHRLATKINLVNSKPSAPFFIMPKSLKAISSKKAAASGVTFARIKMVSESFHSASRLISSGVLLDMMLFVSVSMHNILYIAIYKLVPLSNRATETLI